LINKDSSTKRLVALGGVRSLVEYVCFVWVYLPGSDDFAAPRRLDSIAAEQKVVEEEGSCDLSLFLLLYLSVIICESQL
jgi:hypothetical protein